MTEAELLAACREHGLRVVEIGSGFLDDEPVALVAHPIDDAKVRGLPSDRYRADPVGATLAQVRPAVREKT